LETDAQTSCDSFKAFEVDNSDQVDAEDCSFMQGSMDFELFLQSHMLHFKTNEDRFNNMKQTCDDSNDKLSGQTTLCDEQSDETGDQKGECDTAQKEFEEQACELATTVRDDWSTYKSCFDAAKVALSTLKTDLADCEAKLQEEYAVYSRVKCYVNVSCSSDSDAQIETCDTTEYLSPHLKLSWFEEPSEEPISDDKDIDTCSESFISEFLSESEAAPPAACTPCLLPEIN
jgi:hypothetical protein